MFIEMVEEVMILLLIGVVMYSVCELTNTIINILEDHVIEV